MLFYHAALRVDQTPCTGWRHYLEALSLILVQCADHGSLWVPCTKGQWYRDIFARVWYILPCSFCSHPSKDKPLSNNMLTVIRFRVGYVHLSLILIKKKKKKNPQMPLGKREKHTLAWQCAHQDFRISSNTVSDCPTDGIIPHTGWDDFFWQMF